MKGGGKRGQFTSNLRGRWTIPITTGGCQVSRGGYKGTQRGARGQRQGAGRASGIAPCIYVVVLYAEVGVPLISSANR